jgi:glycosyltransferase involved in cell wall biosynthesis
MTHSPKPNPDLAVSVVIPTYNGQTFLPETLQSIFEQSQLPGEILVVDDHSTDDTCAVVTRLMKDSPIPLRLVRLPENSGGPATPMNVGIRESRHSLIALMDHDDLMMPDKLACQVECFRSVPELDIVFGDCTHFDGKREWPGIDEKWKNRLLASSSSCCGCHLVSSENMLRFQLLEPGLVQGCSNLVFRKHLWEKNNQFDPRYKLLSDYVFKLRACRSGKVGYLPRLLFRKRTHNQNLFDSLPALWKQREIDNVILEALQANPQLLEVSEFRYELAHIFLMHGWYARCKNQSACAIRYYWQSFRLAGFDFYLVLSLLRSPFSLLRKPRK